MIWKANLIFSKSEVPLRKEVVQAILQEKLDKLRGLEQSIKPGDS